MGFNRRKIEDQRRQAAEKEAAARRATDAQVLADAERAVRRARAAIADQHRGRNADRAHAAGARRVIDGPGRRGAASLTGFGVRQPPTWCARLPHQ